MRLRRGPKRPRAIPSGLAEVLTLQQLAIARDCRAALKKIFLARPGGRTDHSTLTEIEELCLGAMRAVEDPVCGGKLVTIHCCAAALYSDTGHERWANGTIPGLDVLRRKIFRALNTYQRRLYRIDSRLLGHESCFLRGEARQPREQPQEDPFRAEGHPPAPGRGQGIPARVGAGDDRRPAEGAPRLDQSR
jgi:hypothetical protein